MLMACYEKCYEVVERYFPMIPFPGGLASIRITFKALRTKYFIHRNKLLYFFTRSILITRSILFTVYSKVSSRLK